MGLLTIHDGSYYVARAGARLGHLTSSSGFPTGAVWGAVNMFGGDWSKAQPDFAVVVFDRSTKGEVPEREKIYADYKAGRVAKTEEDVQKNTIKHQQRRIVKVVLNMCGIRSVFSHKGWEADDTMGALAVRAADAGHRVLIFTGDKDITQLVSSKIRVLDTKTGDDKAFIKDYWADAMNIDRVTARYEVPPSKIAELLALNGDAVDGVPGIKGITIETAAELLNAYGSIKGVCAEFNKSNPKGIITKYLKCTLLGDAAFLKRNLQLVRLNTNLISAEDFNIEDYKIDPDNQIDEARKYLQTEFGFKDIPAGLLKYLAGASGASALKKRASMFD